MGLLDHHDDSRCENTDRNCDYINNYSQNNSEKAIALSRLKNL